MKKEFEMVLDGYDADISYYYQEWHISGDLKQFLNQHQNEKVKITIEILEEDQEEMVTVTYRELFSRAYDQTLMELGVNLYYLNEGGEPTNIIDIPKSIARQFMGEDEFNARKHDENT